MPTTRFLESTIFRHNFIPLVGLLLLTLLLSACGSTPVQAPAEVEDRAGGEPAYPKLGRAEAEALRRYHQADYAGAASRYQALADQATDPMLAISQRLAAADSFARANDNTQALNALRKLNGMNLDDEQLLRARIVESQLALNTQRPRDVFSKTPADASAYSLDTQVRLGELRADALIAMDRVAEAIMERIDIDPLMTNATQRAQNHQWIWKQLQAMPAERVFSPPSGMSQDDAGWWSLAAIAKKSDPQRGQRELDVWKQTYPGHPATEDILFQLEGKQGTASMADKPVRDLAEDGGVYAGTPLEGTPRQVALLLPLSGSYEKAGRAVLAGFREMADKAALGYVDFKVYDTADPSYSIDMVAQAAVQNGAQMLVGPLQKDQLSSMLAQGNPGVPVLALNQLGSKRGSEGLFQYSLSPENDAQEAARKAIADGRYRTAVLASQDAIGERIANAFMREFEAKGGRVVAYDSFPPNTNQLSQIMKRLLRAESANPLWEDVRKGTNRTSNAEQKIDMIFFTASPRDARIVRPVVQLQRAYDLPVYSTGRLYAQPDPAMDRDLEGLVFCDMPMRLRQGGGNPLRAMGRDAYRLVNSLEDMSRNPGVAIPGETGRLSLNYAGDVYRKLDCAMFKNGQPIAQ